MQSRQKAWHDRAMHSHQRDPICVGDWVYHYQGKIKPIGHKFVPKWKAIDEEESESEKEREEEEAEVEGWCTEVHWEELSDEDTGKMEVKMKLRDTYGKPEKEFDWHWIMRTPLHKYAQHQVNINQEIRMVGTVFTDEGSGEYNPFVLRQEGIGTWIPKTDSHTGTRVDYEDGLQGVRLEVMWIFHHFHNEYPIDWASILLKQMVNAVQRVQEARDIGGRIPIQSQWGHLLYTIITTEPKLRRLISLHGGQDIKSQLFFCGQPFFAPKKDLNHWHVEVTVRMNRRLGEEKPKEVPTEENAIRVSKSEPMVAFLTVFTIREDATRMTAIASSSLLPLKVKKARCKGKNTDSAWFNNRELGGNFKWLREGLIGPSPEEEQFYSQMMMAMDPSRGTIWFYGKEILLNNKFFSKVFAFPNEVYEMEKPPSKIYNEYRPYLKEGTTWEEHLARRAKTRRLQLSEFCAEVVAVLRPLSVIMGCRNNPKSVPINVLWVFITADRNRFMNWAMIFRGLFFRVVETARKLMMKNNGGNTILYLLAHMSTFLDLRVGDYYKFRPYRMLTDIPDHRTTMAFFKRVETEEDGLFRLLKPGEPTDRVVTGIEEEETDAGEEDGPAAGSGWGGLYIDTSSKEGVQLYFDKTARTHPVPRPDTPPPAVCLIPRQIIQIIMTQRQLLISAQAVCRARTGKAPAELRAKKAGGRGADGSPAARLPATPRGAHIQVIPVHPASANSPTPLRSSAPPFEIPVVGATEVTDMEQEHHQERREEEVPADPWGGFTQEPELQPAQVLLHPTTPNAEEEMGRHQVEHPSSRQDETCKRAHSPPHNGKGEHRKHCGDGREEPCQEARPSRHQQHKDTAQIFLTLAHEEEISQKLEGRLCTMEEKVSQFEGHLIGVQKFIEEHHKQLLTAITNLSERLPTTTDLPEDEQEELRQLRETNERYEQFFSNMPRPPVCTKGH
ncbi:hypothetical protein SELMODRAFT_412148 [Selaginella moellendorffii]|uniref:Uncharacterized protein n=1 Tax=Selaginella moellendorffii TaxID=88036 RepID=D8RK78_SELML|nr:hypothetical protein SELMODRAFT_412148 [Selaginella moellendorffii]